MATQIFVELPVKDLEKSKAFFTALGFEFDQQFTDEKATRFIIGENIYVMLLVEDFFRSLIQKNIADTSKSAEVINSFSVDSKEKVDDLGDKALAAGVWADSKAEDCGWMYARAFQDIDGHLWQAMYIDLSAMPTAEASVSADQA